jgi:5'-methylthioadenosine phosphorylase
MHGRIGVIGGSGLGDEAVFTVTREVVADTLWGSPSAALFEGVVGNVPVVQLSRHGREHTLPPSQVNYRANVQALRDAGCACILATTAVGSLRREIRPGDLVVLDQFIDFTRQRKSTYSGGEFAPHQPVHPPMADPFDGALRAVLCEEAAGLGLRCHTRGTVVTIEGPRFSTRAESRMFRIWGADVINMSVATEAALANELRIPYAAVAMCTDYDSWDEQTEAVSWQRVMEVFHKNVSNVTKLLLAAIARIAAHH